MGTLKTKQMNLEKAISSFKVAVQDFEKVKTGSLEDPKDYIRDTVIKRFEFTLDTAWKFIKEYLEKERGFTLINKGPKAVFRECLKANLLSEGDVVKAIEMVDSRNMTSHIYKEEIANLISKKTCEYFDLIVTIFEKAQLK